MIDLSRISPRSRLGRILRLPLKLVPRNAVFRILQGRLRGKKWIVGSGNHGYWLGSYELEKRRVFENTVRSGSVVFDIGAHVGFYTLLSSVLVGTRGEVFAFEPVQKNLRYLREHLRLNNVSNVNIVEAAVADRDKTVSFHEGGANTFTGHVTASGPDRIRAVSLDELLTRGEIPLPDYMKIDVEGAEMLVLLGAKHVLAQAHPVLFLATHGEAVHKKCCDFLRALGYRLKSVDGKSLDHTREIIAF